MVLCLQEESGKKSEHQEMLLRLEWELEERQRYSTAGCPWVVWVVYL